MRTVIGKIPESINLDGEKISGAAYDTAWTARVTDESGKPLFPECIKWLLENQKPDGSWGSEILNYHDRLISTLTAIMTLKEIDERQYSSHIQRGEVYIWENMKNLNLDNYRLIGSELLFPSLMQQAEWLGLDLPYHVKVYQKEYQTKLEKIDESLWYSPLTTLSFSLEFLGDNVDVKQLSAAQLPNGSVATSPAATAFFLRFIKDKKAVAYLKKILSVTGDGSVMTVYPIEVFESSWIMYNFMLAGVRLDRFLAVCDFLFSNLKHSGVCWSLQSPLTSADETAVVLKVLCDMQYPVDFDVLTSLNAGDYFMTLPFELDPSVSTNAHVLEFVKGCPAFGEKEEVIEKLIHFLKKKMCPEGFWVDKWHTSPYYCTSHAVFALCGVDSSLAEKAVSWILDTQYENGLWGENGGTLEETAYAVQALLYYHQEVDHLNMDSISKAFSYLGHDIMPLLNTLPELWVGKVLYCPKNVVLSAILSASSMYNTTVWNLCSGWSV